MSEVFINIHSHRKPQLANEFLIRNAYHFLSDKLTQSSNCFFSVGIHPWHTVIHSTSFNKIQELASNSAVIAIGEVGLDRAITIPIAKQLIIFEKQFNLAQTLNKPLIIHCVKAISDLIPFLKKSKVPFIFHHYSGNKIQTLELLKLNCYFSFGKELIEKNKRVLEALSIIPAERIFLETDQMTINIAEVYEEVSSVLNISLTDLQNQMLLNFHKVFPNLGHIKP